MSLPNRIFAALLAGAGMGILAQTLAPNHPILVWFVRNLSEPLGRMWLSALIMVVIPLILSTLSTGVAALGSLREVGRLGALTLLCFLFLTATSSALGIFTMNLLRPGAALAAEVKQQLLAAYAGEVGPAAEMAGRSLWPELVVKLIPRNPVQAAAAGDMLAVIVFALFLGVGLATAGEKAGALGSVLESLAHTTVAIINLVMRVAPVGVFCLIFSVSARFGWRLLLTLSSFVVTVVGALAVFQFVVYPVVVRLVAGRAPLEFLRRIRLVMVTAFSTSSSNATLPTTMRVAQDELGISREVAGFVLPLGATLNMNGTALFEGATVLFLAQVFGVPLSLKAQVLVVLLAVVTAIGTAGVPGGSLPLLMMVLATVGVPPEGIAVVFGVDRLLDMCRTTLNVTGDLVTASIVERWSWARFESGR
ncbi:MAG: dicarboxylate/amino acid:cation symporter [Thermoanaerobaculum sp.]|nr:dicarboxylate/amino acid:cation symporter [Thermoanaerobaculum sp.]